MSAVSTFSIFCAKAETLAHSAMAIASLRKDFSIISLGLAIQLQISS
jgi:hypothetical protein